MIYVKGEKLHRRKLDEKLKLMGASIYRLEAVAALLSHEYVLVDLRTSSSCNKMTPLMFLNLSDLLYQKINLCKFVRCTKATTFAADIHQNKIPNSATEQQAAARRTVNPSKLQSIWHQQLQSIWHQQIACGLGYLPIAEYLIEKGADIEVKDSKKRTALSHAVLNGQEHSVAMLLSRGADLIKGDSSGNTPAHYASAYGWLGCLRLLATVDPTCLKQENDWKLTPLSVAYMKEKYECVKYCEEIVVRLKIKKMM
ncbi:ankyrin repeat protein [Dictyocaulus viviparus]|uniref:Ankyrin repeat protein n=1 Tax=Dictyocaulus viviparus TaxID=29172 RepID=A0A0D8Y7P5_DICVI|nr:ankyrin repeat protein [Dictyocaulus viviparus]